MASILGYEDLLQNTAYWNTRTVIDSSVDGAGDAAYPASNLIDPDIGTLYRRNGLVTSTPEEAIIDLELEIDPQLAANGILTAPFPALIGILNVNSNTPGVNVRIQASNTSFGGTTTTGWDMSRTVYMDVGFPRNVWFVTPNFMTTTALGGPTYGGVAPPRYWRFHIGLGHAEVLAYPQDISIGRIVIMRGFVAKTFRDYRVESEDYSDSIRSESGYDYVRRRPSRTVVSGKFVDLQNDEIYGESLVMTVNGTQQIPSIRAVNYVAGTSGEVAFLPSTEYSTADVSGGMNLYPGSWQTNPVFGRLEKGLRARMLKPGIEPDNAVWEADFSIIEIVP
jgi:hypothetical protein